MARNVMPSLVTSKVASSTSVCIVEVTAFHSEGEALLAVKVCEDDDAEERSVATEDFEASVVIVCF